MSYYLMLILKQQQQRLKIFHKQHFQSLYLLGRLQNTYVCYVIHIFTYGDERQSLCLLLSAVLRISKSERDCPKP